MRIGVIGAGRMGQLLARLAVRAGYRVQLANSADVQTRGSVVRSLGAAVSGAPTETVAHFGDLCIVATRWEQLPFAASQCGDMRDRVVVDVTNNRFGLGPADVYDLRDRSSSEVVAALFPGARVVKAFNNQPIDVLGALLAADPPRDPALYLAGDDPAAKALVSRFIRAIGAHPLDVGDLTHGGRLMSTGTGPLANLSRLLSVEEATALLRSATRRSTTPVPVVP